VTSESRADWRTVLRLAFRHLVVRRGRAVFLLVGYGIGVGVMMVLLSIGEAMLIQSRDVALVGGGEVTVLPEGIDLEGLRSGSMSGLFFGIDQARFLDRQLIGGPRLAAAVSTVSPAIEHKLVYLRGPGGRLVPLRAGGEVPSAARALGAGLPLLEGDWRDEPADSAWRSPTRQQLYDQLDHFHTPPADSTWAEWHYFNVAPASDEWWYVTYLVGGDRESGRAGGQLLVTRHRDGAPPARFEALVPIDDVATDTVSADVALGANRVEQRDGRYRIVGRAGGPAGSVGFDLTIVPEANAYFPPVELTGGGRRSGYVVPAIRAVARGTLCEGARCRRLDGVPAYHDHNWGIWRATVWNWGQARGTATSVVYGGVIPADSADTAPATPYFLAAVDSLGVRQIFRFDHIDYEGARPVPGAPGIEAPERLRLVAGRDRDSLSLAVTVRRVQATPVGFGGERRYFLQMRGAFTLRGRLTGAALADSGLGFFETFVRGAR